MGTVTKEGGLRLQTRKASKDKRPGPGYCKLLGKGEELRVTNAAVSGWEKGHRGLMPSYLVFYSELVGHINHPRRLGLAHLSRSWGE